MAIISVDALPPYCKPSGLWIFIAELLALPARQLDSNSSLCFMLIPALYSVEKQCGVLFAIETN